MPRIAGSLSSIGPVGTSTGSAPKANARAKARCASRTRNANPAAQGPCSAARYAAGLRGSWLTTKLMSPCRHSATCFDRCRATHGRSRACRAQARWRPLAPPRIRRTRNRRDPSDCRSQRHPLKANIGATVRLGRRNLAPKERASGAWTARSVRQTPRGWQEICRQPVAPPTRACRPFLYVRRFPVRGEMHTRRRNPAHVQDSTRTLI